MADPSPDIVRLMLHFQRDGDDVVTYIAVPEDKLAEARRTLAATHTAPTDADLNDLLLQPEYGGKLDRADGPAWIQDCGDLVVEGWFKDGKKHRTDGPAVTFRWSDGLAHEIWFQNGKRHRTDGPALIERYPEGNSVEEWWSNGRLITREETPALPKGPKADKPPTP